MQLMNPIKIYSKAFTLIELMMVVVIIGMMAVFAIPNYAKSIKGSYGKTGQNNLLIIYAAQSIKNNSGAGFQSGTVDTSTTTLNTNLNLGIIPNGFTYTCAVAGSYYKCTAARTDASFTLMITGDEALVCCAAGSCPSSFSAAVPSGLTCT